MATVSLITIGVIAWLVIHRPLVQPPPFSFIPTSDDLIHLQLELKDEIPDMPGLFRIYSFPADFNSICLRADTELLSLDYKKLWSKKTDEIGWYKRVSDTGSSSVRLVRIVNNRMSEKKGVLMIAIEND